SYRDSVFKKPGSKDLVIVSATFRLTSTPRPNLAYKDLKEYFAPEAAKTAPSQSEIRDAVIKIRAGKFPDLTKIGTAGSFWKNPMIALDHFQRLKARYPDMPSFPAGPASDPSAADPNRVKVPLAWILDKICGLKGAMDGNVGLYEKQPLALVAKAGATASDIKAFEAKIRLIVKEKTAIDIEPEVGFL
ncbi:UDP-N-acetylenolpyruvoylglucosamine reductase, partial [Candidatus Parcubacteria bacterium]|nr:UDP-N-acetylenolpyruvoylglucosamine reductase [Candidatus Parcubacteria bacterium]